MAELLESGSRFYRIGQLHALSVRGVANLNGVKLATTGTGSAIQTCSSGLSVRVTPTSSRVSNGVTSSLTARRIAPLLNRERGNSTMQEVSSLEWGSVTMT